MRNNILLLIDRRQAAAESRFRAKMEALTSEQIKLLDEAFPISCSSTPGRGDPFGLKGHHSALARELMRAAVLDHTDTLNRITKWRAMLTEMAKLEESFSYGLPPDSDFQGESDFIGTNQHLSALDNELTLVEMWLKNGTP